MDTVARTIGYVTTTADSSPQVAAPAAPDAIAEHVAFRMASHVPAGPLRDLLAGRTIRPEWLSVAASDDVAWRQYKQMSADRAAKFVAIITSSALLDRIAASDQRAAVRRALAENPALSPAGADAVARAAQRAGDDELARALLGSRTVHDAAVLLLEHRLLGTDWAGQLAWRLYQARDDELVLRAVDECGVPLAREILDATAFLSSADDPRLTRETMLRLLLTVTRADPTQESTSARAEVHRLLLPDGADVAWQRRCLRTLGTLGVRCRLVELYAAAGRDVLSLAEILTGAEPDGELPTIARHVVSHRVLVDLADAPLFDSPQINDVTHRQLTCTPAARAYLARSSHPTVAAAHIDALPAPLRVTALRSAAPEVVKLTKARTARELSALVEAGLPDALLQSYAAVLSGSHTAVTGAARERLLTIGGDTQVAGLRPATADLPALMARPDLEALPTTVTRVLKDEAPEALSDDQRRALAVTLQGAHLERWLGWTGRVNGPHAGDWLWLHEHGSASTREVLAAAASAHARTTRGGLLWEREAARVCPLVWNEVRAPEMLAELAAAMSASFGDDQGRWVTALRMVDGWAGTPADLCSAVNAVHLEPAG